MNEDRLGLPVRLGGPSDGPVARLIETPEGVVSETWDPSSGAWVRNRDDLASVMSAPPAEPDLLERLGVPVADRTSLGYWVEGGVGDWEAAAIRARRAARRAYEKGGWRPKGHPDRPEPTETSEESEEEPTETSPGRSEEIEVGDWEPEGDGPRRAGREFERKRRERSQQTRISSDAEETAQSFLDSRPDWEALEMRAEALAWAEENPEEFEELVNREPSPPTEASEDIEETAQSSPGRSVEEGGEGDWEAAAIEARRAADEVDEVEGVWRPKGHPDRSPPTETSSDDE